jgi:hypothetical protein
MHPKGPNKPILTVGEVRQALGKMGRPWQVDPRLSDDEPIPDPPRGGQADADIPVHQRFTPLDVSTDLSSILAVRIPTNPFLRARWIEAGLCGKADLLPVPSEDDDKRWGAS